MHTPFPTGRFTAGRSLVCLLVLSLLLALSQQARAQSDVSVVFTPDTIMGVPGSTVNYTALLTNTTNMDLLINGASFTSNNANFFGSYGNSGIFNGSGTGAFTLSANSSMSYTDVVSVLLSPTTPAGTYAIDTTFTGHSVGGSGDGPLGTGGSNVIVAGAPTPEFGSVWSLGGLLLAGGMGAWSQMRRQRHSSAS